MVWSALVLWLTLLVIQTAAQSPKCVCYQELDIGLKEVSEIEAPPDGSGRLFLCHLWGEIWIMDSSDTLLPEPFMNVSTSVTNGLMSMAFHPDYTSNGRFYIYRGSGSGDTTQLSEFTTNTTDPNRANMTSERILRTFYEDGPDGDHVGGDLVFGVDGLLYLALGDGTSWESSDAINNAQNKSNPYGGIIRIDVDSRTGDLEYGIPPDNPFISDPEAVNNTELYALGLRNPWRMTMDLGDRTTQEGRGRMLIADVGEADFEEVDILRSGGNYGWSAREGPQCEKDLLNCPNRTVCITDETETCPVLYYNRTVGKSIIGGHVYRGCVNTDYDGWYFFADYKITAMHRMLETSPDVYEMDEIPTCASCSDQDFVGKPYTIGRDSYGEQYLSTAEDGNHVYRLYDPDFVGRTPCRLF